MQHKARKRFGQNFLQDTSVIMEILAHIQVKNADHWVEIGAGMGALTAPLLNQAQRLDVVELDRDLVAFLQQKFTDKQQLNIYSADALKFDFASLVNDSEQLRIIGNLPYNISTPLMFHLLSNVKHIQDMHFMLQKEVVERLCASAGSKKYGRLSVMMAYFCSAEFLFDVPPESFDPIPKVMSAIVCLTPHLQPPVLINDFSHFEQVVKQAFSQRRKTIRNSLSKLLTSEQMLTIDIDPSLRAENLSLDDFARLSNLEV